MKQLIGSRRKQPAPPPPPPPESQSSILMRQAERLVGASLVPAQIFMDNLRAFRGWYPVLIPVLLWYLRYRYRIERRELAALAQKLAEEVKAEDAKTE